MILEIISGIILLMGAAFMLIASVGVIRLPDALMRMHATTKAGTLGAGLVLVAVALTFTETAVSTRVLTIIIFILLTAPVAAHIIGRAAYYVGVELWKGNIIDELSRESTNKKAVKKEKH